MRRNRLPLVLALVVAPAVAQSCPNRGLQQINAANETPVHSAQISPDGEWIAYSWGAPTVSPGIRTQLRRFDGSQPTPVRTVLLGTFQVVDVTWRDSGTAQELFFTSATLLNGINSVYRATLPPVTVQQDLVELSWIGLKLQAYPFKGTYCGVGTDNTNQNHLFWKTPGSSTKNVVLTTTDALVAYEVDATERYLLYSRARPIGSSVAEELWRYDIVGQQHKRLTTGGPSLLWLSRGATFVNDAQNRDILQSFGLQNQSPIRFALQTVEVNGALELHTNGVFEEFKELYGHPTQLANPATPKRWVLASGRDHATLMLDRICLMPVDGGGEVVLDRQLSAYSGQSMDRDAKRIAMRNSLNTLFAMQTDRPLRIQPTARVGQTSTLDQPVTATEIGSVFFSGGVAPPVVIPPYCGSLELDPATMFTLYSGLGDPSGAITVPIAIPNDPALRGTALYFQGLRVDTITLAGDVSRLVRLRIL
ncbi:MAG: hypothetical protein AAF628_15945 [Planctomycetota bacterium]